RERRDVGADLLQHHAKVEEAEAEPARRLRQRDPEQVRLRELLPRGQVVPVVGAIALLQVLEARAIFEDPRREAAQLLLFLGKGEVHVVGSLRLAIRRHRGLPGMFSPKMAIRSRCISLTPPPKVRMCIERSMRSTRPAFTAPGESPCSVAWSRMTSMSSRAA